MQRVPVSGLYNRCLYNAVGPRLGMDDAEMRTVICDTLHSIDDALTLARYGLSVVPDAGAAEIAATEKKYVDSPNTSAGAW